MELGVNCMEKIISEYKENEKMIQSIANNTYDLIKKLISKEKIQNFKCRIKSINSLEKKIKAKDKYNQLSDITDVIGFRVITYLNSDVDKIYSIIKENFVIDKINTIDKRYKRYNEFGYKSLHVIFSFDEKRLSLPEYADCNNYKYELQLRTVLQHAWAEIEHDLGYKTSLQIPDECRRTFYKISMLLEFADDEFEKITNHLKTYKSDIEKNIKEKNYNLPLNIETLGSYLLQNVIIDEINNSIKLMKYDYHEDKIIFQIYFNSAVDRLIFVGIDTIEKLDINLIKYKNILPICLDAFFKEVRYQNNKLPKFDWSVPVIHLINIIISQEDDNFKRKYLEKFFLDEIILRGLDAIYEILKKNNL